MALRRGYVARLCVGVVLLAAGFVSAFTGMQRTDWLLFYNGTIVSWIGITEIVYNEMRRVTEGIAGAKHDLAGNLIPKA